MYTIIIIILLVTGLVFTSISWLKNEISCPPPHIIYRYVPENIIDTQFSQENLPSNVYNDMFNSNNILVGGMSTTIDQESLNKQRNSPPFMSMSTTRNVNNKTGPATGPSNNF